MITTKKINTTKKLLKFFKDKNFAEYFFSITILIIMLLILYNPKRFTASTISGIKLFFFSVFPGLFPFMLLTKLLTELGTIYKISSKFDKISKTVFGTPGISFYAFLMSIISGYPIGSKIICDLYSKGLISQSDAKKMSVFCTTSGPIFVIGTVGSAMFCNLKIGIIIYISHILSSIILGILYNLLSKKNSDNQVEIKAIELKLNNQNIFSNCVTETINSMFVVGAYITIFYLLTEILESLQIIRVLESFISIILVKLNLNNSVSKGLVYGIIEVTRGCKELSIFNSNLSISLACGLISFSGISIIMQSMVFLKFAKIKMHNFVLTKIMHLIFSIFICSLLILI